MARRDYVSAYVDDLPSVIDIDAIRRAGIRLGVDPLGGASVDYWKAIARAPRARARDRQRRGRPDLPLRPARLGRQDPHGLLLAVRDGAPARAGRSLRRRVRQRSRRRPPRDRHADGRAAQPEPPPRRVHRLPVRRPPRLGPGRRHRQDARQLVDHRPRRGRPRAAAGRGAGRLQVVRRRAARRDARLRRRGERRRVVPAPRRRRLEHRQGRADPVPARGRDEGHDRQGPGRALRRAGRPLRACGLQAHRRGREREGEGRAQAALARPGARATSWPASRSSPC